MLGAMLLFFGRQENIPALKWWGTAYLLGAASVALWTLPPRARRDVFAGANAVGFVACGMVWNAARVFHGRKPNLPGLVLGAIAWVARHDAGARPRDAHDIGAGIVAVYAALTATELWSERAPDPAKRWPAFVVPVLHGLVLMLPILLGDSCARMTSAFTGSIWVTVFSVELVLYAIGTVFVIFMLVSERAVTAHKTAASMDPLTGMFNRRGFAEASARVIEREASAGRPVTVLIFDIDHFKSINDRFGHPAGDEILKLFATIVVNTLRITDLSGRIGGEEFAALLPCSLEEGSSSPNACARHSRLRESCARTGRSIPPSASASPAARPAPNSRCCWPRPTPRSIRPSAAAAIASRRRRNCRCRWKTGGARPPGNRAAPAAPSRRGRRLSGGVSAEGRQTVRGNLAFTIPSISSTP